MARRIVHSIFLCCFCLSLIVCSVVHAQVDQTFKNIFSTILVDRLRLSPGNHGSHFLEADTLANTSLVTALNSLIAGNISSFPLSSTSAGVKFDFSSGLPVSSTESSGPIFAETGETIGQGKISLGVNYTYLDLSKFRGLSTQDMRFTFLHQDLSSPPDDTLGNKPFESDYIDVTMGMNITAHIVASSLTYGVTDNFDVGVAVPVIYVNLHGIATARINSGFTFGANGKAFHYFGGDSLHPVLETSVPYDANATGLGDVALRAKYCFLRGQGVNFATLADVRFPSGKKENFMGDGKINFRLSAIFSDKVGDFSPHLNLGYQRNTSNNLSDQFLFTAGFDNRLFTGMTFAFEVIGSIDLNSDKAITLFPGTAAIYYNTKTFGKVGQSRIIVPLSNIPDRNNDNVANASLGVRYAPSDNIIMFFNVLTPLNDGGLRAPVIPTIGVSAGL